MKDKNRMLKEKEVDKRKCIEHFEELMNVENHGMAMVMCRGVREDNIEKRRKLCCMNS